MKIEFIFLRGVQCLGIFGLLVALGFWEPLANYLFEPLPAGETWNWGEAMRRFACVSGPLFLSVGLMVGMQYLIRYLNEQTVLEKQYPDQPWMWQHDWAAKHIQLNNKAGVVIALIGLAFYLLVLMPVAIALASQKNPTLIYSIFGAIGLFWLGYMRLLWLNRLWNRSELKFDTLPGVIGGPFTGVVILKEKFSEGTPFRITLQCQQTINTQGSRNKGSSTRTETVWQDQKVVDQYIDAGQPDAIALPVSFAIPYECTPTSIEASVQRGGWHNRHYTTTTRWRLSITLKESIGDVRSAVFEIPVFKTADSKEDYQEDTEIMQPFLENVHVPTLLKQHPYVRETIPGGTRLRFSLFSWVLFFSLVGMIIVSAIGLSAALMYVKHSGLRFIAGMFPGAFLGIGIYCLFEILCWSSILEFTEDTITVNAGFWGMKKGFTVPRKTSLQLVCHEEFRKENGAWFCVQVMHNNVAIDLVKRLDGRQEAEAVRKWLRQELYSNRDANS